MVSKRHEADLFHVVNSLPFVFQKRIFAMMSKKIKKLNLTIDFIYFC